MGDAEGTLCILLPGSLLDSSQCTGIGLMDFASTPPGSGQFQTSEQMHLYPSFQGEATSFKQSGVLFFKEPARDCRRGVE